MPSKFLKHEACPKCKSKNNLARYDDGHATCFGCGYQEQPTKDKAEPRMEPLPPPVTPTLDFIETKGLLIGEAVAPAVRAGINDILQSHTKILAVNEVMTMHMGPEDVFCALSVDFSDDASSVEVEAAISNLEQEIKLAYPEIKRIFIEAQSVLGHANAASSEAPSNTEHNS